MDFAKFTTKDLKDYINTRIGWINGRFEKQHVFVKYYHIRMKTGKKIARFGTAPEVCRFLRACEIKDVEVWGILPHDLQKPVSGEAFLALHG